MAFQFSQFLKIFLKISFFLKTILVIQMFVFEILGFVPSLKASDFYLPKFS